MWWCVLLLLVVLIVGILRAKLRGESPQVFGYSVLHIVSGSMEPEIPTDTYILTKSIAPEQVERESIISFYSEDSQIYGLPNTHRVVEILNEEGKIQFLTKGDANPITDSVKVDGDRLIGVYVTDIAFLTAIFGLTSQKGFLVFIILLQIATAGLIFLSVARSKKDNDTHS